MQVLPDHVFAKWYRILSDSFLQSGAQLEVIVFNAPNLTDAYHRNRITELVEDFKSERSTFDKCSTIVEVKVFDNRNLSLSFNTPLDVTKTPL